MKNIKGSRSCPYVIRLAIQKTITPRPFTWWQANPPGGNSLTDLKPIQASTMPQELDPDDSIQTLMDVIAALELSPGAHLLKKCNKMLKNYNKAQWLSEYMHPLYNRSQ